MMLKIQDNHSLLLYNTFKIDVKAKYFVEIKDEEKLKELFNTEIFKREKKLILGGGSNILFTKDFDGLVIHYISENRSDFVKKNNEEGNTGLENLIDIPGMVNTAPVSNIGAYGVEVGNLISQVEGYDLESCEKKIFTHDECKFSYRDSVFKSALSNSFLITKVKFELKKFDENYEFKTDYADVQAALKGEKPKSLKEMSDIISEIRRRKLPDLDKFGCAGSFFKNPIVNEDKFNKLGKQHLGIALLPDKIAPRNGKGVKLSAAKLIEEAGMKGYSNNNVGIYEKHALILVNQGGSANDVLEMMERVQNKVNEKFEIWLEPEVVII